MNIPSDILKYADRLGLLSMATGGGVDYVYVEMAGDRVALLADIDGVGSPDGLRELAVVGIKLSEDWADYVDLPFKSAKDAMDAMQLLVYSFDEGSTWD